MLAILRYFLLVVSCVISSVLGLLVCVLRPFNPSNSRLCARIYGLPALYILGIKVEPGRMQDAPMPCVFIGNHQSNYDLFVIGSHIPPRTVSLGKKSLKWIPLFGQIYWLAGNILVDRGNARQARDALQQTTHALSQEDTSIWVFPEGTRNHSGTLLPFKKGAFQMAINAGVPIVPVCLNNYTQDLDLNRWHSATAKMTCLPAIETKGMTSQDINQLMQDCQALMTQTISELDAKQTR